MTKPITAAAAILLYEEGHFHLNTPISQFLPAFKDAKVFLGEGPHGSPLLEDQKTALTFRHLFTHTAGISYGGNPADPLDKLYQQVLFANPWTAKEYTTIAPFIDKLATLPLAFQPGSRFRYGYNLDVLGRLVEVISGKTLDAFLQERIFEPLGMVDTGFYLPDEKCDRLAEVYAKSPENSSLVVSDISVPIAVPLWGGGGLLSTLDDYARFTAMLVNKGEGGLRQGD